MDVRFIEYMPFDGNRWNLSKFVPYRTMLAKVMARWEHLVRLKDDPSDTSKVQCSMNLYQEYILLVIIIMVHKKEGNSEY